MHQENTSVSDFPDAGAAAPHINCWGTIPFAGRLLAGIKSMFTK